MATKTPYAIDKDGNDLYVKLKYSGIDHLIVMFDGISITFFGKQKTSYLKVIDAISWHEKELRDSYDQSGSELVLVALRSALKNFEGGEVIETV